jgi:putative phosphoesterase
VISDSHDHLPEGLRAALAQASEIWHLGDFCAPWVLEELRTFGPPVSWVRGNNDFERTWPEELRLERGGCRFFLTHIEPSSNPPDCDYLLFGHSHVPEDSHYRGIRRLNPGALFRPRSGSSIGFAWLEAADGLATWSRLPLTAVR